MSEFRDPRIQALLWACMPMLPLARGTSEWARGFRLAWIDAAKGAAVDAPMMTAAEAARALHALSLELGDAAGVPRHEFVQAFNDRGESGVSTPPAMLDTVLALSGRLLALCIAREAVTSVIEKAVSA